MKLHGLAVLWWATIEILLGRIARQTGYVKAFHQVDWARQEGVMAELLCIYDRAVCDDFADSARPRSFQRSTVDDADTCSS